MRFCVVAVILSLFAPALLHAQTNAAPANASAAAAERKALAILTTDQLNEYAKARVKALADDPALNAENEALKEQFADVMVHGTAAQKQAMIEKVDAHRQKLRQAMLKEDPNLEPIFAQIDKSMSELKAKGTAGN
jgi:regulator of replication initiation timing